MTQTFDPAAALALVRERIRLQNSSRPDGTNPADGTAYDCVLDLLEGGYSLCERDGRLIVRPPSDSVTLSQDLRERITRHKPLILALMRPRPDPFTPGWEEEWKWELDSLLRKAAETFSPGLRDDMLALSRRTVDDQSGWFAVAWQLMEIERRMSREQPSLVERRTKTLTPFVGWIKPQDGEWRDVARHEDEGECLALTREAAKAHQHVEVVIRMNDVHPDQRKKPR